LNILLLRHFPLVEGFSMRTFADQIAIGMRKRGHTVEEITANSLLSRFAPSRAIAKWFAYIDMFVFFPPLLWWRLSRLQRSTLCVVVDQALGPWIPLVAKRPHFVHVHDLLSLEAALGLQPFHRLGMSGRLYQFWIRHGFIHASFFLSVSNATRIGLERQLQRKPVFSQLLLNPLMKRFRPMDASAAIKAIKQVHPRLSVEPFLFHIGRNWYKNRRGLLQIWEQLHTQSHQVHLVLVGSLEDDLYSWVRIRPHLHPFLHVLDHASDDMVLALYNHAAALLFPSHAEGFGWPILEALACGCPVITTGRPPMSEVGGDAAAYIDPYPSDPADQLLWSLTASKKVVELLNREEPVQEECRQRGLTWVKQFELDSWLDHLESTYLSALHAQLCS
jgi:glycosyltransferase involved in cell wall biosynthesis